MEAGALAEDRKVALVTGTSSGIGLSTAVALARAGFSVVATMRDLEKASALRERAASDGVGLDIFSLDVADPASIDACVSTVIERHGRIDLLVNNAGAGHLGSLEQTTLEECRGVLDVNFFGIWNTTRAVLPHMRVAGRGRIISLSSVGGIIGQPFNDAYCAAKFAVEGMMESLAPVLLRFGIHVSLVEPGAVNTSFVASVSDKASGLLGAEDDPYRKILMAYLGATREAFDGGQTGDDVAEVIVKAATDDEPHFRYQTSAVARAVAKAKFADPDGDLPLEFGGRRLPPLEAAATAAT